VLLRIAAILFPIFAIAALGYLYARRHPTDMGVANRLNMDVFVPALVFAALADRDFAPLQYLPLAAAAVLLLLACGVLGWLAARSGGYAWKTVVPPMMFNNCGNIGLPLAVLAWGQQALPAAVMLFMVGNLLHFSLGARMLDPAARLLGLWRIPSVAAMIGGFAVNGLGITVWPPLHDALQMLGGIAIPLLLFALGVRMTSISLRDVRLSLAIALMRPLLGALLAWALAVVIGLGAQDTAMLIVFGTLPPAVLNFLFAERYRQEPEQVASIVLIGNLAAVATLPLVLALVLADPGMAVRG
jgi:malate permease and related proteins